MGKYDLWNKNTKKLADKYNADIIKKHPKYGCIHHFYIESKVCCPKSFTKQLFKCYAVNPANDNKDGEIAVLIGARERDPDYDSGHGYYLPGKDINKFLKEYSKKILNNKNELMSKYSISAQNSLDKV